MKKTQVSSLARCFLLVTVIVLTIDQHALAIRCSVCDSAAGHKNCNSHPPPATECPENLNFCLTVTKYSQQGSMIGFSRNCSPLSLPSSCRPAFNKLTREPMRMCFQTCSVDGCNGSWSVRNFLDLLR